MVYFDFRVKHTCVCVYIMHPRSFKDLHTELLNIEDAMNRSVVPYSHITCVANQELITRMLQ